MIHAMIDIDILRPYLFLHLHSHRKEKDKYDQNDCEKDKICFANNQLANSNHCLGDVSLQESYHFTCPDIRICKQFSPPHCTPINKTKDMTSRNNRVGGGD